MGWDKEYKKITFRGKLQYKFGLEAPFCVEAQVLIGPRCKSTIY